MDRLEAAWAVVMKDFWVWLIRAMITTLAVSAMWWFWEHLRSVVRRALGLPPAGVAIPVSTQWRDTDLARLTPLTHLASGVTVPEGTRMIAIDRGTVQFELAPGRYSKRELKRRLAKHDVGAEAVAVQMPTGTVLLERTLSLPNQAKTASPTLMRLGVVADPHAIASLKRSPALRDGVLTKDEVFALMEEVAMPWLSAAGGAHTGVDLLSNLLVTRLREDFGLVGSVQAVIPVSVPSQGAAGPNI